MKSISFLLLSLLFLTSAFEANVLLASKRSPEEMDEQMGFSASGSAISAATSSSTQAVNLSTMDDTMFLSLRDSNLCMSAESLEQDLRQFLMMDELSSTEKRDLTFTYINHLEGPFGLDTLFDGNHLESVDLYVKCLHRRRLYNMGQFQEQIHAEEGTTEFLRLSVREMQSLKDTIKQYDDLESKVQASTKELLVEYRELSIYKLCTMLYSMIAIGCASPDVVLDAQHFNRRLSPAMQKKIASFKTNSESMSNFEVALRTLPKGRVGTSKKLQTIAQNFNQQINEQSNPDLGLLHYGLHQITTIGKETVWREAVINMLQKIEVCVRQSHGNSATLSLFDVYKYYRRTIKVPQFDAVMRKALSAYVGEGRVLEALERAEVLRQLEQDSTGQVSDATRILIAGLKNLLGDHTEWLALEAEKTRKETEKKNVKNAKIARRVQAVVRAQKQEQEKKEEQAQERATKKQKIDTAVQQRRTQHQSVNQQASSSREYVSEAAPSSAVMKAEKQARHAEAEAERLAQELESSSISVATRATSSNARVSEPETPYNVRQAHLAAATADPRKIAEFFTFTHASKAVNTAIENNTWQFTRGQLAEYFRSMGCDIKSGKGSHEKVSLPDVLCVLKDGEVITVLSDMGGALTLPAWEKIVPHYLRSQILEARLLIKCMAMNAERERMGE